MKFTKIFFSLILSFCFFNELQANCGSATCPLNNHHYLRKGWLRLTLTYEYINQDQIYVGTKPSYIGALPSHHDEIQTLNQRNILSIQYGITDAFAIGFEIPFIHRKHSHISEGEIETFNFSGLGDVILTGQYAFLLPSDELAPYLSFQVGLKLPSGVTDATNTKGEEAEITIQPGTGSTDLILGLNYRQTIFILPTLSGEFSTLPIIFGTFYQINGKGKNDYRIGNTLLAHFGTSYQFIKQAGFLLQVNAMIRDYDDVSSTEEFRQNTGGIWIFVSPGLNLKLSDEIYAYAYVQIPVYRNLHGIQQTSKMNFQFGLSASLNLIK
jgi:hypothetical protein